MPAGQPPVAPSSLQAKAQTFIQSGAVDVSLPRALSLDEIQEIIEEFVVVGQNALAAGFDGVELHAANGYLLDQFMHRHSNQRRDRYGGSIVNRARFSVEFAERLTEELGPDRVGIRFSPINTWNDMQVDDMKEVVAYVIHRLNSLGLAFLHMIEQGTDSKRLPDVLVDRELECAILDRLHLQ